MGGEYHTQDIFPFWRLGAIYKEDSLYIWSEMFSVRTSGDAGICPLWPKAPGISTTLNIAVRNTCDLIVVVNRQNAVGCAVCKSNTLGNRLM